MNHLREHAVRHCGMRNVLYGGRSHRNSIPSREARARGSRGRPLVGLHHQLCPQIGHCNFLGGVPGPGRQMGFGLPARGFGLVLITKPHKGLNLGIDPPPLGGKSPPRLATALAVQRTAPNRLFFPNRRLEDMSGLSSFGGLRPFPALVLTLTKSIPENRVALTASVWP